MIFAVAMLPGIVASRAWLSAAGLRPEGFREYRLGSIFVWSAASGLAALLNAAQLKSAVVGATGGTLELWGAIQLVLHLLVGPWVIAVVFGLLARKWNWVQDLLGCLGVIRPGSRTPWDEIFGHTQSMQVTFSWEGRTFSGYFARADTEGTQLYVEEVYFEADGEWRPVPEMSGALILNGGDHVLWLYEPPIGNNENESDEEPPHDEDKETEPPSTDGHQGGAATDDAEPESASENAEPEAEPSRAPGNQCRLG